jgi:hypothetical protein
LNAKSKAICDSYRNLKEDETNEWRKKQG